MKKKRTFLIIYTVAVLLLAVGGIAYYNNYVVKKHTSKVFQNSNELVAKYNSIKQQDKMDLSSGQDLAVAIMNLVGIEEHLFFTGAKTRKNCYYDLINEVRELRKRLLKKLIPNYEGEIWCISKHLLAASYRLMETGTKQLDLGNQQEAYTLFNEAYKLYLMFWQINMQSESKKQHQGITVPSSTSNTPGSSASTCVFDGSKINCCNE